MSTMYEDSESGGSGSVSNSSSPSLLTNLRHFRFQKTMLPKVKPASVSHDKVSNSADDSVSFKVHPRKKVRRLELSDDDDEPPAVTKESEAQSPPQPIVISDDEAADEAEAKLKFLQDAMPGVDKMVLQDKLICCDWNVDAVLADYLSPVKKNDSVIKRNHRQEEAVSGHNSKKRKKKRRPLSDGSSDDDAKFKTKTVFDSSDSEQELDEPSDEQKKVLEFLSTATDGELTQMPNCSAKKAHILIQLKPFTSWRDLVEKLQQNKGLNTNLLTSAQESLRSRAVVLKLMKKCVKLATQMETAIEAGITHITKQPSNLDPSLKLAGYQLMGLNWLITIHEQGLNGILADEMGLGKTVQVISLLAHLKEVGHERIGPHLVVVPSSTLDNWRNEFARWCPSLNVVMYHGSQEDRRDIRSSWFRDHAIDDVDVIVSTYNIVGTSPDERKMFRVMKLDYVILDEAHMLKNMATLRYENLMRINAKHRVLLTGTPLQNTLLELMSLLIFVMPHMFSGSKDYLKSLFARAPTIGSDDKSKIGVPRFEETQVDQARRIMKPFVLRRLKSDVLQDLPTKSDETVICDMAPRQKHDYLDIMKSYSKDNQILDSNPANSMTMMMTLRKLANHPALLRYHYTDDKLRKMATYLTTDAFYKQTEYDHILEDLSYMSDFELHQMTQTYKSILSLKLPDSVIVESGKLRKFDELLPSLKSDGHRVLIFSQFVIMLNIIEEYLRIRKYRFCRLDGSTAVSLRQELIDEYNKDDSIFIFLLSTRAGGLGINLTAADTVLIHDIDFNPYNDKQAEDRCHRMGQTRNVTVIRMLSKDSIEEGIYQVAQEKLNLERKINNTEGDGPSESKSVVRLLKQALGLKTKTSSPKKSS